MFAHVTAKTLQVLAPVKTGIHEALIAVVRPARQFVEVGEIVGMDVKRCAEVPNRQPAAEDGRGLV